jgi:hypothetical protein
MTIEIIECFCHETYKYILHIQVNNKSLLKLNIKFEDHLLWHTPSIDIPPHVRYNLLEQILFLRTDIVDIPHLNTFLLYQNDIQSLPIHLLRQTTSLDRWCGMSTMSVLRNNICSNKLYLTWGGISIEVVCHKRWSSNVEICHKVWLSLSQNGT